MKRSHHASDVPKNKAILIQCKICHAILLIKKNDNYFWFIAHGDGNTAPDYHGCNHYMNHHKGIEPLYGRDREASNKWLQKKTIWYGL